MIEFKRECRNNIAPSVERTWRRFKPNNQLVISLCRILPNWTSQVNSSVGTYPKSIPSVTISTLISPKAEVPNGVEFVSLRPSLLNFASITCVMWWLRAAGRIVGDPECLYAGSTIKENVIPVLSDSVKLPCISFTGYSRMVSPFAIANIKRTPLRVFPEFICSEVVITLITICSPWPSLKSKLRWSWSDESNLKNESHPFTGLAHGLLGGNSAIARPCGISIAHFLDVM